MKTNIMRFLVLFLLVLVSGFMSLSAQEPADSVTDVTPAIALGYLNISNDTVILTASISVRRETGNFALQNADIEFLAVGPEGNINLGKGKTDHNGSTVKKVALKQIPVDKEGKATFSVSFAGKGKYLANSETVTYKQARLAITFTQDDSIKTIHVKGFQVEANGELKPLQKEMVNIYIPRMLSNLKIGEVELDEAGMGSIEYPGGIVGDSLGKVTIYAMIEENDNFGTVKGEAAISWGIPKQYYLAEKPTRELWTPVAPVWMIITLIIMLTGVWAHYVYAVVQLIMIKRISKQQKNYF